MRIREIISEAPISPTPVFIPYHGNYCGPGNRGGMPIDCLDKACFKHDVEYDRSYREERTAARARRKQADIYFIKRCIKIAQDKSIDRKIRLKAYMAVKLFVSKHTLAGAPIDKDSYAHDFTLPNSQLIGSVKNSDDIN